LAVVVLDTCVLFSPSLRDLLLTLAALDAYSVRWSDKILTELSRRITETYSDIDPEKFEATTIAAIRSAFPDAVVTGWEALVDQMDNDPDDRHVAAAAVTAGADTIVTLNVSDFAGRVLSQRGIRVATPGELVLELLDDLPEGVVAAVVEMAARKRAHDGE
jgi:predicted nucleic acid-binding protein